MRVILHTRCGCSREIEIEYPPKSIIMIPLHTNFRVNINTTIDIPARQIRSFKLINYPRPFDTAEYMETE
mgnify:CR=1 FL=1